MATKDEVVSAITHIMNTLHSDQWRGNLNNFDFQQLKSIYEDDTPGSTYVKDTLLGALRNQWPTLFDPKTGAEVTPQAPPAPTAPAGSTTTPDHTSPENTDPSVNNPPPPQNQEQANAPGGQAGSPQGTDDELSGKAAETAKKLDDALAKNRTELSEADVQLSDAILSATTSDEAGKAKLNALKQSIIDEVNRIGPEAMNTRAGMEEFATFLQGKTSDIMNVANTAKLDSESQSKVMDAIGARLNALAEQNGTGGGPADPDNPNPGQQPAAPGTPADPGVTPGGPEDPGLPLDPLLTGGLPSDPFMQGLGGALGPALGAMGSLPSALGSAIPSFGGGGAGLSDLGPAIGSALRDAGANGPGGADDDDPSKLKDPFAGNEEDGEGEHKDEPGELKDPQTQPAGNTTQQNGQPAAPGEPGQPPVAGAAPAPGPDLTVKVDGLGEVKVDNPALANAAREVLNGGNVHDAFNRFNIPIPPPGTPVTENAVSPGKTVFGDIGQYTDHQIMALGDNKAWVNGEVVPLDKVEQGTSFLGWMHPTMPASATPVAVTSPPPVMTPQAEPVTQAAAPAPAAVPAPAGGGLRDVFPGLSRPS